MRIVSLAPSNTEILFALGCGDLIVACTRYCDYPAEALKKPRVGGWLDVDDELVLRHLPDVVMTSTFVQDAIVARYREKGITLFHTDPKTLEQVYGSILSIGKVVNKEEKANELVHSMKKGFGEIQNSIVQNEKSIKTANAENQNNKLNENKLHENQNNALTKNKKIKAYCEEWHKPPMVSGNWVPKIIEIAGGISLCPEGKISYPVSLEEVEAFDPDCIVVSLCGMGETASSKIITERGGWDTLRAVKKNRIFVIDDSLLNRPGPRLVEGARKLSSIFETIFK